MKIAIIGSGYVGLVTGACFSEVGVEVVCVDIDHNKIEKLKNGIIPIYELGLELMIKRNVDKKRLTFTTNLQEALIDSEVIFIAVGTPPDEDGSADLKYVLNVARDCGKYMTQYKLVVTKSTVPVGTSTKVKKTIQEELNKRKSKLKFDIASNPEFLKEGAAIDDFLKPDRIVIGTESNVAKELLKKLYKPFILNGHPIIFINDIANLCEIVGANINEVRKGISSDSRIGNKFLYPGIGYGGSCFPKDVQALIKTAGENNYELKILKAVEAVNKNQKTLLFNKILNYFNGDLKNKTVALWGVSFKPQTNDMREAPSLKIIKKLIEAGANVKAYDPEALDEAKEFFGNTISYESNQYEALVNADCLAVLTEWSEFKIPNFKMIYKLLETPVIFDGRNIYDTNEVHSFGIEYHCIGIKTSNKKVQKKLNIAS